LLNDHVALTDGPFYVPATAMEWKAPDGAARRGAVSTFGFSGTNVHIVVEEALVSRSVDSRGPHLAVLSAQSETALERILQALLTWFDQDGGRTSLTDICATLARGRSHFRHRAAFVANDAGRLRAELKMGLDAGGY